MFLILDSSVHSHFRPNYSESPPSKIDDFLLDLEDPVKAKETIKKILLPSEAGWLIRAVKEKLAKDREMMNDSIERDLEVSCISLSYGVT